jgi:hypothetical protein
MIAPRKGGVMIYDKLTGEIFRNHKYPPCPPDTISRRHFLNDIDGIMQPANIYRAIGSWVIFHQIIDLKENLNNKCIDIKNIKFPAKRQEFIDLIESSNEEDNPILQIFHLRL